MSTTAPRAADRKSANRWMQLTLGVICMILIANLQYGWTLFVHPMAKATGWDVAAIQVAFSIFVALETWLTPVEGWIADTLGPDVGPRVVIGVGGLFVGLGWIVNSYAGSLGMLYFGAVLSGIGGGAVYATCVGNAVKWFPDRRGLAVGLTAAGFGAGSVLTVIPIRMMIASAGYADTFFWFGLIQGAIIVALSSVMRFPHPGEVPEVTASKIPQNSLSMTPKEMLKTPVFWLLYLMFVMISAGGLMATAQIALIATSYHVADSVLLFGAPTLTVVLIVDGLANGGARPLFGWISDKLGRENTMAVAFGLGAIAFGLLANVGSSPWAFVICAALIFFTWGEIFSLFPSTCTDSFGQGYATTNACFLYTAKGLSAFLVPLANVIKTATGSWHMVFVISAAMYVIVVLLALFVLKPMRKSLIENRNNPAGMPHAHAAAAAE
ncbi:oxalate/formate MFS antiporter [Acidimangrovimonas sediminis]|uniref:oxalate/formate MFS antiporter n=1 Tax=Acidimangrovimonas sediminis TaxID=2056283 RepID=UPI000C80D872|nr:oxalate/formate MFS antiporter [Acidimangrovimonas sediminis]